MQRSAALRSRSLAALLACSPALLLGCGVDLVGVVEDGGRDPATAADGGGGTATGDGGSGDGGSGDGGMVDGGMVDGGMDDGGSSGAHEDGGVATTDAGAGDGRDGGPWLDAATDLVDAASSSEDAGEPTRDAGALFDAGAGSDDAGGAAHDAGSVADDAGDPADAAVLADGGAVFDAGPPSDIRSTCFPHVSDATVGPNYDQFSPVVGSHCYGTNHQDIAAVERVVFLGDSVTVGSQPTFSWQFYRTLLADRLATHFGLTAPDALWKSANVFTGRAGRQESGAFASCAEWGAQTRDLLAAGTQLEDCLPEDERQHKTLVVITVGGNDLADVAKDGRTAPAVDSVLAVQTYVDQLRAAVEWIKAPGRFPNGVHVVFANVYEFTDGTADLESCPAVGLGDFVGFANFENWEDPTLLKDLMVWANEEYMDIAVDTGSDMMFLFEHFCGHGFHADDPSSPCYRGPNTPRWFDLTCIHPNPTGHARIADMFMQVVLE